MSRQSVDTPTTVRYAVCMAKRTNKDGRPGQKGLHLYLPLALSRRMEKCIARRDLKVSQSAWLREAILAQVQREESKP